MSTLLQVWISGQIDMELGRRLSDMGYLRHKQNKGIAYRMIENP